MITHAAVQLTAHGWDVLGRPLFISQGNASFPLKFETAPPTRGLFSPRRKRSPTKSYRGYDHISMQSCVPTVSLMFHAVASFGGVILATCEVRPGTTLGPQNERRLHNGCCTFASPEAPIFPHEIAFAARAALRNLNSAVTLGTASIHRISARTCVLAPQTKGL
ncbi:uncharacterized protein EI90DRAFT_943560 [Cantharellus anzutake]|uniref:uncharacterized protein n=1 Tax=Cantharellus anzutake TaxID=1750568 RepID=UPI001908FFB4|nr:uncharacterized protein EI90DRAFT_943560 [Cantharellus anzutake]KAF8311534.1 hypothetical protein EI90DRAFT_943560 [Cantharellus anzutake]